MKKGQTDFVKRNVGKAYELLIDFIRSEDVENEDAYCKMRMELKKLKVAIPKDIYDKIEDIADEYLDPIIYDNQNFFAELYTEEIGYFDEKETFHMRDEAATFKFLELFLIKIRDVEKKIEKFGMEEIYPILVS